MSLIWRWIINAAALLLVAYVVPGISVSGLGGALVAAAVLGLVNTIIRPLLVLLSLPLEILSLGLFTLVINAALFWFVGRLGLGLVVSNFGAAFLGAIAVSVVSFLLSRVIGPARG
jgi:putative membrane protein